MINRIFKTILVLSIVLGITLPSNAAVSVSDGSAFVTKAEFAADLNNLSNRMAQLENSLDAKIDSLVSSYLSRNGIWNGAKQEVLNYWKPDGTRGATGFKTLIPSPISVSGFVSGYDWAAKAENVLKSTKTGLLISHFGYRAEEATSGTAVTFINLQQGPENTGISGNAYNFCCSVAISPSGSRWNGDYDGSPNSYIAYEFKLRHYLTTRNAHSLCSDLMGFVEKDKSYDIFICARSVNTNSSRNGSRIDKWNVYSYYDTSDTAGFGPSFVVY